MLRVRPWDARDASAVTALAGGRPDHAYPIQLHRLHGPPRDGPGWSRTLVADVDGRVAGAVSVLRRPEHPGRYLCVLIVAPGFRRRGVGRLLADAARQARPQEHPLAARISPHDPGAVGLLTALGGRVYQRCPGVVADLQSTRLPGWIRDQPAPGATRLITGLDVEPSASARAWADSYQWVHEGWSPIGDLQALSTAATAEASEADDALSVFAVHGRHIVAAAWVYVGGPRRFEVVCETTERNRPDGATIVAAVVGEALARMIAAGGHQAEFDGHLGDPHLYPVLSSMPDTTRVPVDLVEVD